MPYFGESLLKNVLLQHTTLEEFDLVPHKFCMDKKCFGKKMKKCFLDHTILWKKKRAKNGQLKVERIICQE